MHRKIGGAVLTSQASGARVMLTVLNLRGEYLAFIVIV